MISILSDELEIIFSGVAKLPGRNAEKFSNPTNPQRFSGLAIPVCKQLCLIYSGRPRGPGGPGSHGPAYHTGGASGTSQAGIA